MISPLYNSARIAEEDEKHLAARILGKSQDSSYTVINGQYFDPANFRDISYDNISRDLKAAATKTRDKLVAGDTLTAFGVRVNPIDPKTGQNMALKYYNPTSIDTIPKNYLFNRNPQDLKIAFHTSGANPDIQSELDQLAVKAGISQDRLDTVRKEFFEHKGVGGITEFTDPKHDTIHISLPNTRLGLDPQRRTPVDGMGQIISHECCHTMQVTSHTDVSMQYGEGWGNAIFTLNEGMTDVGGKMISDNSVVLKVRGNDKVYNAYSYTVDSLKKLQADIIGKISKNNPSLPLQSQLDELDHVMFLAMTNPMEATQRLQELYGKEGYKQILKIIDFDTEDFAVFAEVKGISDQVLPINVKPVERKIEKENFVLTDSTGILDVDTCSSSKVSIGESFQVYNHCANRAQLRLKVKQTDKIDYSKLKIIDSLDNKVLGDGNSEFFVNVTKDRSKNLIFRYTNDKGVSVNLGGIAVSILKLDQEYLVPLNLGWQTFSPLFDPGDYKASDMLKDISSQGGYVTAISTYQEGAWQTYKVRGDQNYGTDFKIEQGKGYFLLVKTPLNYISSGIPSSDSKAIKLNNGWNLVGLTPGFNKDKDGNWQFGKNDFKYQNEEANKVVDSKLKVETDTKGYTAKKLLELLKQKSIQANIVTKWEDGRYNNFIVESDTSDQSKFIEYGFDYYLYPTEAYFVRVTKSNGSISP